MHDHITPAEEERLGAQLRSALRADAHGLTVGVAAGEVRRRLTVRRRQRLMGRGVAAALVVGLAGVTIPTLVSTGRPAVSPLAAASGSPTASLHPTAQDLLHLQEQLSLMRNLNGAVKGDAVIWTSVPTDEAVDVELRISQADGTTTGSSVGGDPFPFHEGGLLVTGRPIWLSPGLLILPTQVTPQAPLVLQVMGLSVLVDLRQIETVDTESAAPVFGAGPDEKIAWQLPDGSLRFLHVGTGRRVLPIAVTLPAGYAPAAADGRLVFTADGAVILVPTGGGTLVGIHSDGTMATLSADLKLFEVTGRERSVLHLGQGRSTASLDAPHRAWRADGSGGWWLRADGSSVELVGTDASGVPTGEPVGTWQAPGTPTRVLLDGLAPDDSAIIGLVSGTWGTSVVRFDPAHGRATLVYTKEPSRFPQNGPVAAVAGWGSVTVDGVTASPQP
jgi:hypothetical protein